MKFLNFKNPLSRIAAYKESRGMSFWTDVRDWLGGWPMEFAGIDETKSFCKEQLGLELLNIYAGEANTEYLFRKQDAKNYWDEYISDKKIIKLTPASKCEGGNAWSIGVDDYMNSADSEESPKKSTLMLYENGVPMGFPHVSLKHIARHGKSRYAHWKNKIIFSTTDNTDPNTNGREYYFRSNLLKN